MSQRRRFGAIVLASAAPIALALPDAPSAPAVVAHVEIVGSLPTAGALVDGDLLPYQVQAVTRETLREADTLTGLMARKLNGVNVNEVSGSPFQVDVTYRGYRASPVLGAAQGLSVYLDGVRVNEAFGDVVNWDMVPEAAVGKLIVMPASNPLYGLNTLGGALVLQTRSGLTDRGGEVELSAGTAGRRHADVSFGARNPEGWHSFVAATLFDERGWRAHSAGRLGNLFIKAGHAGRATEWTVALLGGASSLLGNGLLPGERIDGTGLHPGLYEEDRSAVYTFPDRTRNQLVQASFSVTRRLGHGMAVAASAYARGSRRDTDGGDVSEAYDDYVRGCASGFGADGGATAPESCSLSRSEGAALHPAVRHTTRTRQHGAGSSVNLHAARNGHVVDAGFTYDRSDASFGQVEQEAWFTPQREVVADPASAATATASVNGGTRAAGLYASGIFQLAPSSHLSAAVRLNHARVASALTTERGPQAPQAFTYVKLNPSIGITHQTGALTWLLNAAQGNRVPTAIELGCADPAEPCRLPVGLQSDPRLEQVVARTVEAGVRGRWDKLDADVSLYRTANRDDILFMGAGAGSHAGYFANFARTLHEGAAVNASWRWGGADWRFGYSYLHATYDAAGTLYTGARTVPIRPGTRIAGLPLHTLKLGAEWGSGTGFTFGADLQAVSAVAAQGNEDGLVADADGNAAERRADWSARGHALLDLHAQWRLGAGLELFARASNVLDRRYETYAAVGTDMFPNGQLLRPHAGPVDPAPSRFVAPGAARLLTAGLRYRF